MGKSAVVDEKLSVSAICDTGRTCKFADSFLKQIPANLHADPVILYSVRADWGRLKSIPNY